MPGPYDATMRMMQMRQEMNMRQAELAEQIAARQANMARQDAFRQQMLQQQIQGRYQLQQTSPGMLRYKTAQTADEAIVQYVQSLDPNQVEPAWRNELGAIQSFLKQNPNPPVAKTFANKYRPGALSLHYADTTDPITGLPSREFFVFDSAGGGMPSGLSGGAAPGGMPSGLGGAAPASGGGAPAAPKTGDTDADRKGVERKCGNQPGVDRVCSAVEVADVVNVGQVSAGDILVHGHSRCQE